MLAILWQSSLPIYSGENNIKSIVHAVGDYGAKVGEVGMLHRIKTRFLRQDFYHKTAEFMNTPAMPIVSAPWRIVSMVSNSYVQMYTIALKSFYQRLGSGHVTAIIDQDMPESGRATLEQHFPGIEFAILEDIDTGTCQRGGTWERLLYLIDRSREEYVIQLDADTLTFGDVSEVKECVKTNVAFTLNGSTGAHKQLQPIDEIRPMKDVVENARRSDSKYIGIVAERRFAEYLGHEDLKYVRGSSAFVGLSHRGVSRDLVERFHAEGERIHGKRWFEWGTEQSASNFAVANSPGAIVLPYPKYGNFDPKAMHPETSFLHFIGSRRYVDDTFATLANREIPSLNKNNAIDV